jgi:hypothetical protein
MEMHLAALFTHDATGRMVSVNEPNEKPAPRFFLGRTSDGNVWRFRHDLGADVIRELEEVCRNERTTDELLRPPYGVTPYAEILERDSPIVRVATGPAFTFPTDVDMPADGVVHVTEQNVDVLRPYMGPWLGDVEQCQPFKVVMVDGAAVSVCASVRITPEAHEAGVDTHPEFRRRGYAVRAAAEWARAVRAMNAIPLYSTSWENVASRAVAARLGLVRFGADLHIT